MPAYVVITRERLRDQAEMDKYRAASAASGEKHPMKVLAIYGEHETLEGASIEGGVILEFPDMAAARTWYDSPGYQKARIHRWLGGDYRIFILEGLPEPMAP